MCDADIKQRVRKVFEYASTGDGSVAPPDALFVFNRNGLDSNYLYLTGLYGGVFNNCGLVAE